MSKFKNSNEFELFYSDTDSIDISSKLREEYIGKELGQLKLEYIFRDAVYLAPKVYGGLTESKEIIKIKGSKTKIKFEDLKSLLFKDSIININQEK